MADEIRRFQWSRDADGAKEIIVVRGDDRREFLEDVEWAKLEFPMATVSQSPSFPTTASVNKPRPVITESMCEVCGNSAKLITGISKNGKPYKLLKCSIDEEHAKFL